MIELKYLSQNKKGFSIDDLKKINFDKNTIYTFKSTKGIDGMKQITLLFYKGDNCYYLQDKQKSGKMKLSNSIMESRKKIKTYMLENGFIKNDLNLTDIEYYDSNIEDPENLSLENMEKEQEFSSINKKEIEEKTDFAEKDLNVTKEEPEQEYKDIEDDIKYDENNLLELKIKLKKYKRLKMETEVDFKKREIRNAINQIKEKSIKSRRLKLHLGKSEKLKEALLELDYFEENKNYLYNKLKEEKKEDLTRSVIYRKEEILEMKKREKNFKKQNPNLNYSIGEKIYLQYGKVVDFFKYL